VTEHEAWGFKVLPNDADINRQFRKRPESMFEEEEYSELETFWKEVTALGNPEEYGMIGRTIQDQDQYAETVAMYFPGGRQEIYQVSDDMETVNIAFIDEEGHQHGFNTVTENYEEVSNWMQEIIELEDDFTWREW